MVVNSVLRAATLSLALAVPTWSMSTPAAQAQSGPNGTASSADTQAQPPQTQAQASYVYPTARLGRDLSVIKPAPGPGNSRAQGRYYDDEDQYLDWNSGVPRPGAPGIQGSGG